MDFKENIGKIFPIIDSTKRKEKVSQEILSSKQKHRSVINVHRNTSKNIGDYYCAPHHYFNELKNNVLDINGFREISPIIRKNWIKQINANALIIGGGGLLNIRHFQKQMQLFEGLAANGKKIVIWGTGHNKGSKTQLKIPENYTIDISKFGLVGTRDHSMPGEYVPCVSCLHPIFSRKFKETRKFGLVFNNKSMKDKALLHKLKDYPSTSNMSSLEEVVNFIGSTEIIVTNSYHAMYWGMLLNKKTVVIPTTSKFYDFKYNPVFSTFDDFERDLNKAQSYSGVLEECREINRNFAKKNI